MGKKRKAGGRPFGRDEPRNLDGTESKLRVNTYEDVADSEDEFHINRDKILLEEGPAQKRQRKIQEDGKVLGPSHFFRLRLIQNKRLFLKLQTKKS